MWQEVSNASSITICQVDVRTYLSQAGDCDAHLEIWDMSITGQIGGDSDTFVTDSTSKSVKNVTWSSNKPNPSGDYTIVMIGDEDGSCGAYVYWTCYQGDSNCYEDSSYDTNASGSQRAQDCYFIVHTDQ